jgi:predicted DNA-binding transcriptional regulator AlpA
VSRTVKVENLIEAQGIADRLGLAQRQTIDSWMRRHPDFPRPLGTWGRTRLWDWSEVEAWARRTGRLPDRQV